MNEAKLLQEEVCKFLRSSGLLKFMRHKNDKAAWMAKLSQAGWFCDQPDDFKDRILEKAQIVEVESGQYLYHFNDDLAGVYGILDGGISGFVPGRDGTPRLASILRQGTWFGIGPFLTGKHRTLSFAAHEDSRLVHLSLSALQDLSRDNTDATRRVGAIAAYGLDLAIRAVSDLLIRQSDKRLAATLLRIAGYEPCPADLPPRTVRVSQAELAEMANCSRDLANRILAKFSREGWIEINYKNLTVLDPGKLHLFSLED